MTDHPRLDASTFDALLTRARRLAGDGRRRILGITGAPGAGKSTPAGRRGRPKTGRTAATSATPS